jgi:DUF1365 family protein
MTVTVIAAIHWEAFRLLIKGVPLRLNTRNTGQTAPDSKLEA